MSLVTYGLHSHKFLLNSYILYSDKVHCHLSEQDYLGLFW